jgi:hypothetical protein
MKLHEVSSSPNGLRRVADDLSACADRLVDLLEDASRLSAADTWTGPAADDLADTLRRLRSDLHLVWFEYTANAQALRAEADANELMLPLESRGRAQ